jgi:GNAT superfamily N-acetyltransferase
MKENIPIVKLEALDVDRLHSLWDRAGLSYRPLGRDERNRLKRVIEQGIETYWAIFEADRLIGVILASHDGRKGWLNRLAIEPSHRGRGLAQQLVWRAEDYLHEQGIEIIAVLIEPGNTASLNLFQKCGYIDFPGMSYLTKRSRDDI